MNIIISNKNKNSGFANEVDNLQHTQVAQQLPPLTKCHSFDDLMDVLRNDQLEAEITPHGQKHQQQQKASVSSSIGYTSDEDITSRGHHELVVSPVNLTYPLK